MQTKKFVPKTVYGLLGFPDPCKQQHCAGLQTSDPLWVTNHTVWIEQNVSQPAVTDCLSPCCAELSEHRKGKRSGRILNQTLGGLCQIYHCPWRERYWKLRMNFSLIRKNLASYYPYFPTIPHQPVPLSPVTLLYFQRTLRQP